MTPEYAGFEMVGIPDRPPQTEREREVYTLEEGEMLFNMGPQHPSTHGVMRLVVKVRGEIVVDLDPVLGYLHRGIEKLCENATYTTVLTYVDPMDYLSTMHNEHAPALAFEKLFGVKSPPRANYIRALVVELNRIFSHGLMIGFLALDMGGLTPILYSFINRDEVVEMLAAISGQRMLFNFFRVGGVNWDVNDEFLSRLGAWHSKQLKNIRDGEALITENEIFRARTRKMGILSGDQAISLGVTGPNLRASACRSTCAGAPLSALPRARVRRHHPVRPATSTRATSSASPRSSSRCTSSSRSWTRCRTARCRPRCRASSGQARTRVRGDREPARPVQRLRHQRRRPEPVSVPHARPELHHPAGRCRC